MADVESRGGGDESTPLMAGKAAGRGGAAGGSRDAHLDNCKFWLMCAVVFNHCFQDFFKSVLDREAGGRPWCQPDVARDPIGAYALARGAYMYLNLLGMPAFTLVSGICSRSLVRCATAGDGAGLATRSRRMVESLLVPYVIWQTVFLIYGTYGTGEFRPLPEHPVPFVSPVGVTWYLTALFAWRCSVQFIATLRNVVAATFIVGLAVGFVDTPQTENGGSTFPRLPKSGCVRANVLRRSHRVDRGRHVSTDVVQGWGVGSSRRVGGDGGDAGGVHGGVEGWRGVFRRGAALGLDHGSVRSYFYYCICMYGQFD